MNVKPQLGDELRRIPLPAKVIAAFIPVCVAAIITALVVHEGVGPTATLKSLFVVVVPLIASGLFAIWVLLVGYVYADAKRRGMGRALWMLVVILVPNALGFILYFLLRSPVISACPGCGHTLEADLAYCPQCGHQLGRSCPGCSRRVAESDAFCSSCGYDLHGTEGKSA